MCVPIFLQKVSVGREFSLTNAKYYTTVIHNEYLGFFTFLKKVLDILYRKMYHCIKELVQQYSDTERSLYMAYVFDNNIPLYLQVIDIIKKKIVAGVYQPGQQLEPVRALAGEYEINPNTIQRALQELENQNLVFSQRTRGRFVTDNLDLIKEERYKMSQVLIRESIEALYSLGFDKEDIVEAYKKILFEEE